LSIGIRRKNTVFEEQISDKNRYIITFQKKEMRKDKEMDKTEIL